MRILGIDPGYAIVGYGVVDYQKGRFTPVGLGAITTPADMPFSKRLLAIYRDMKEIFALYKPEAMAMEKLFFYTNKTTAIDVAQARGVILLSAEESGMIVGEYTPIQVKQSVVGYGRAEKSQVMDMTKRILGLASTPKPDDTADALAVAICHAHFMTSAQTDVYGAIRNKA